MIIDLIASLERRADWLDAQDRNINKSAIDLIADDMRSAAGQIRHLVDENARVMSILRRVELASHSSEVFDRSGNRAKGESVK